MSAPGLGDFAVVSAGGAVGPLISLGEFLDGSGFTQWDHAFVYVGAKQIVQTNPGGAREVQITDWRAGRADALWSTGAIELTGSQRAAICAAAIGYAARNVHYSSLDYLALAAHRLHLPVPWLQHFIADTGHMICSQLVDQCYRDAGVQLFSDHRWPGYVTPADLGELIEGRSALAAGG